MPRMLDLTNLVTISTASRVFLPRSQARIRSNMHGTLTRKFVDLMAEYQELQNKYKNKYREKVERQYRIVKPHATKEEIEEAFDSGNQQPRPCLLLLLSLDRVSSSSLTVSSLLLSRTVSAGNQQPELFTQQILQGPGHAAARSALADIQVRHL